jgi:hypothetical protein
MSTLFHYFLIGRKLPQAKKKSRVALVVWLILRANREALDLFGAVATFAW